MATDIAAGSKQEAALQNALQARLIEAEFISGDDSTIADYIVLMIANGKNQSEIQAEVADTLDVSAEDQRTTELVAWLFQQVRLLQGQSSSEQNDVQGATGQPQQTSGEAHATQPSDAQQIHQDMEAEMEDASMTQPNGSIPTGPKSMRNGARGGSRRLVGNVNRAMDRTNEHSVHRIKGTAGTGRINTHHRDPPRGPAPKGPRNQQATNMQMQQQSQMAAMQNNPAMSFSPEQQMQMYQFYEQQARMMAGFISPEQQQMFGGQASFNGGMQQSNPNTGKSLFERVNKNPRNQNGNQRGRPHPQNNDQMNPSEDTPDNDTDMNVTSSMEVEAGRTDPGASVCRYNNFCTKPDCPYAHQSPAAPPNTTVDMTDECSFGAACMNRKCVGRHPSPAKRMQHKSEQQCKFFPNCTNLACPFVHPNVPLCRNGADCTVAGCKFAHSTVACKFNPCLNSACAFKHAEGQKRGKFSDRVWINPEAGDAGENDGEERKHLSERTFVNDAEEELILPTKAQDTSEANGGTPGGMDNGQHSEGVVT
ncbi:MAG: hypothetical protein M1828_004382 [Chrysothrix sp. TS-e1954]|nr:MAG: hypothetical protein M1828_004382 [Chrysothrix sp. TS-e1954]